MDSKNSFFRPNNPVLLALVAVLLISGFIFLQSLKPQVPPAQQNQQPAMIDKNGFQKAPELAGISGYLNADSNFTIASLKGRVVLVDFWTYTCINCIRTLPYLKAWDEKYADKGLVIIGVHTPEFEFEKEYSNVEAAVEKYEIKYPVVQDNDYRTWNAYSNHYWPHKYLIDADGYIRYDHIGEGGYVETEQQIIMLLEERDANLELESGTDVNSAGTEFYKIGTPELYLGYEFARQQLGNSEGFRPEQTVSYSLPENGQIVPNIVYLGGEWKNNSDSMELVSDTGTVALAFTAKNVNIVAGNDTATSAVIPELDGKPIAGSSIGSDASMSSVQGGVLVNEQRLYNIVSLPDYAQDKELVFSVRGKGFKLYTFTFG